MSEVRSRVRSSAYVGAGLAPALGYFLIRPLMFPNTPFGVS